MIVVSTEQVENEQPGIPLLQDFPPTLFRNNADMLAAKFINWVD